MPIDLPETLSGPVVPSPSSRADDDESPLAPSIPSLASLRGRRQADAIDLLFAGAPTGPSDAAPAASKSPAPRPAQPRPAQWGDLWVLGVRVAGWCLDRSVGRVRRLLG
ncbi:hypothetical protein [Blastococcus haudaquaticus]|uniref:Uncharacterized protein n=1 Tax=Blastococcus haudaquaticus TaxID=1938745 RepID=A0A286GQT6_9ACTN|nr:hypothetical protein [Blastococcus haudaquaticus]SOD97546.1 hypothetical protein SAMN06272739_1534 [Blastococcus haudaquaticus]